MIQSRTLLTCLVVAAQWHSAFRQGIIPLSTTGGVNMKNKFAITCLIVGAALMTPIISYAGDDTDADRSHPKTFVKDSAITTKIKSKLAAQHLTSAARIHVDTDAGGVVWLSGTARSQDEID